MNRSSPQPGALISDYKGLNALSNRDIVIALFKSLALLDLLNLSTTSKECRDFIIKTNELWFHHILAFILDNGLVKRHIDHARPLNMMAFTLDNLMFLNVLTKKNENLILKIKEKDSNHQLNSNSGENRYFNNIYNSQAVTFPFMLPSNFFASQHKNFYKKIKDKASKQVDKEKIKINNTKIEEIVISFGL